MPTLEELYAEYKRLRDEYFASQGVTIHNTLNRLRTSYYIYGVNHKELIGLLDYYESMEGIMDLWPLERRPRLRRFLDEVNRRLHNLTSAARALVDHSRQTVSTLYEGSEFVERYQRKVTEAFEDCPVSRFVQDLRNYILHREHPAIVAELRPSTADVVFQKRRLVQWDRWTPQARSFLDQCPENFSLRTVLTQYHEKVSVFYDWLYDEQMAIHRGEFEVTHALYERLVELERLMDEERERPRQSK